MDNLQRKPEMAALDSVNVTNETALKAKEDYSGLRESEAVNTNCNKNEQKKTNSLNIGYCCIKRKGSGGWNSASLLLVNQGLATLAFFGVGVNLVLFLNRVIGQDNAAAANSVSKWTGTVYLCSLVGAFLSDSYWGRYLTCAIFQLIFVLGLVLLSLSSWLFLIKPEGCGDGELICNPSSPISIVIFYLAMYLVAFGYGGHQPTIATFGADQFDENHPKERISKGAFFCYFYFALNVGSLFSNTILVYYEDTGKWTLGFWVSTGSAILALLSFLLGSPAYRYIKPCGNPLPRVAQVFVAAARKWKEVLDDDDVLYEVDGSESAIKGSRKILHSNEFDVLICTGIYRQILVPLAGRLSGNSKGLTELQRMGIGLIIGMLAMVAAGVTEVERLKRVIPEEHISSLSIFWQIPQYVLVGASEVFMYVGQLEFFNGQAPDGIKSFGSSLCMASISLGNYVSSMLVNMVMGITARGNRPGWIPDDLNSGHMDRFYFLIAVLTAADFVVYVFCAKWYKCINLEAVDDKECQREGQREEEVLSRV
ncbi:hypothetical protein F0562_001384 [Nyssa sinensis]|uniref:Major facilitator superfamily (MFS) profile domain-containing protein n=1 Tax=Nyssa sinensis TaxID=561372 RepID=A0A5J5C2S4_9ASTE|nr:hypothetical protein F0562_001384 [Nyssa sinensis]